MINNRCSNCGTTASPVKSIFAAKAFPLICSACGKKQFRSHTISKALMYFLGSVGLLGLLFLYMSEGSQVFIVTIIGYFLLLAAVYIAELFLFDLVEYTEQHERQVVKRSKRNVWIAVGVVSVGSILYLFGF